MNCLSLLMRGLWMTPLTPTSLVLVQQRKKGYISTLVKTRCAIFQKWLWVLGFWGCRLWNFRQGANVPQSKTSNMQNKATHFYSESILNSVSLGPDLAPSQVVWYILTRLDSDSCWRIKTISRLNSSFCYVNDYWPTGLLIKKISQLNSSLFVSLTIGFEFDSFNSKHHLSNQWVRLRMTQWLSWCDQCGRSIVNVLWYWKRRLIYRSWRTLIFSHCIIIIL